MPHLLAGGHQGRAEAGDVGPVVGAADGDPLVDGLRAAEVLDVVARGQAAHGVGHQVHPVGTVLGPHVVDTVGELPRDGGVGAGPVVGEDVQPVLGVAGLDQGGAHVVPLASLAHETVHEDNRGAGVGGGGGGVEGRGEGEEEYAQE